MCFRENTNDGPNQAHNQACNCYQCFFLMLGMLTNIYPKAGVHSRLTTFTASEKAQKQNLKQEDTIQGNRRFKAVQSSNRSKDSEIELINKEVLKEEKSVQ